MSIMRAAFFSAARRCVAVSICSIHSYMLSYVMGCANLELLQTLQSESVDLVPLMCCCSDCFAVVPTTVRLYPMPRVPLMPTGRCTLWRSMLMPTTEEVSRSFVLYTNDYCTCHYILSSVKEGRCRVDGQGKHLDYY